MTGGYAAGAGSGDLLDRGIEQLGAAVAHDGNVGL